VNKAEEAAVSVFSPVWTSAQSVSQCLKAPFKALSRVLSSDNRIEEELRFLQIENAFLKEKFDEFKQLYADDVWIARLLEKLETLPHTGVRRLKAFEEHYRGLIDTLDVHLEAVPAKVIYRSPSSWNSTLWVNVGIKHKSGCVQLNSPVVVGHHVVGVIDQVSEFRSRVRLITDSSLIPSVRVGRGGNENLELQRNIEAVAHALEEREDFAGQEHFSTLLEELDELSAILTDATQTTFYAKGEIHGTGEPLWREGSQILKGAGFNYDTADLHGGSRDLQTGVLVGSTQVETVSLIRRDDMLMTTGMDGIFPPGLNVAKVTKVCPVKEGGFSFDIEAIPSAGNLDELSLVMVLPPI
jgi:cell shape-determining protein MreC